MSVSIYAAIPERPPRLKPIALPVEHGSWGFLFEPLVAAVAVAPSGAAVWIGLFVIGAFMTRQPLKILLADRIGGRDLPQTRAALKFTLCYGALAALGAVGSYLSAPPAAFLPFAAAAPFAVYQIYRDARRRSRGLLPELLGAAAISSSAAAIALAGGWKPLSALVLWAIFILRLGPSIIYVNARLKLEKGKPAAVWPVAVVNFGAFAAALALAAYELIPALTATIFAVLTARAVWGVSPYRKKVKAMRIGVWEVVYGALVALSVIFGYLFNL